MRIEDIRTGDPFDWQLRAHVEHFHSSTKYWAILLVRDRSDDVRTISAIQQEQDVEGLVAELLEKLELADSPADVDPQELATAIIQALKVDHPAR